MPSMVNISVMNVGVSFKMKQEPHLLFGPVCRLPSISMSYPGGYCLSGYEWRWFIRLYGCAAANVLWGQRHSNFMGTGLLSAVVGPPLACKGRCRGSPAEGGCVPRWGRQSAPRPRIEQHRDARCRIPFSTHPVSVKKNDLEYLCLKADSGGKYHLSSELKSAGEFHRDCSSSIYLSVVLS